MIRRTEIVEKIHQILWGVPYIRKVDLNPYDPPSPDDMPCAVIIELEEETQRVIPATGKNKFPAFQQVLTIVMEVFVNNDETVLSEFVNECRRAIYAEFESFFQGKCDLIEQGKSRILRPEAGISGIGVSFKVVYIEKITTT